MSVPAAGRTAQAGGDGEDENIRMRPPRSREHQRLSSVGGLAATFLLQRSINTSEHVHGNPKRAH